MMMRSNADIIIGIDPDVKKSGLALVAEKGEVVVLGSYTFPEIIEYLQILRDRVLAENMKVVVVVEASWKISHNWHAHRGDSKGTVARKGNDAGRCHEVGRKIVECARYYGLEVVEKLPLKKIWKGKDGKITHEEISAFMAIGKRSNQEERDAALLAWDYAGLPIRIRTTKLK
jgi:hypothetical protein